MTNSIAVLLLLVGVIFIASTFAHANASGQITVYAGKDQIVYEKSSVTLVGTIRDSLKKNDFSYSWRQVGGEQVVLSATNLAKVSFVAPAVSQGQIQLVFEFTVSDREGRSIKDAVVINVKDSDNETKETSIIKNKESINKSDKENNNSKKTDSKKSAVDEILYNEILNELKQKYGITVTKNKSKQLFDFPKHGFSFILNDDWYVLEDSFSKNVKYKSNGGDLVLIFAQINQEQQMPSNVFIIMNHLGKYSLEEHVAHLSKTHTLKNTNEIYSNPNDFWHEKSDIMKINKSERLSINGHEFIKSKITIKDTKLTTAYTFSTDGMGITLLTGDNQSFTDALFQSLSIDEPIEETKTTLEQYVNSDYNLSFNYPSNWLIEKEIRGGFSTDDNTTILQLVMRPLLSPKNEAKIVLYIENQNDFINFEQSERYFSHNIMQDNGGQMMTKKNKDHNVILTRSTNESSITKTCSVFTKDHHYYVEYVVNEKNFTEYDDSYLQIANSIKIGKDNPCAIKNDNLADSGKMNLKKSNQSFEQKTMKSDPLVKSKEKKTEKLNKKLTTKKSDLYKGMTVDLLPYKDDLGSGWNYGVGGSGSFHDQSSHLSYQKNTTFFIVFIMKFDSTSQVKSGYANGINALAGNLGKGKSLSVAHMTCENFKDANFRNQGKDLLACYRDNVVVAVLHFDKNNDSLPIASDFVKFISKKIDKSEPSKLRKDLTYLGNLD